MNALMEYSIEEAELWTLAVFPPLPDNLIAFPVIEESVQPSNLTPEQEAEINRIAAEGRDATIAAIRKALKTRSGKSWSVTGGRGTSWGWIRIHVSPARLVGGKAPEEDLAELAALMGEDRIHPQGISIPSSNAYYRVNICQAVYGHPGNFSAQPYWD